MKIIKPDEIKLQDAHLPGANGVKIFWAISQKEGAKNFAMRMFEIAPGGYSPKHTHPYEHEVYILEGEGKVIYEGKEYELKKDYIIFIPPDKEHQFINTGNKILKFLCLIPIQTI